MSFDSSCCVEKEYASRYAPIFVIQKLEAPKVQKVGYFKDCFRI